jgi:WD40 repeat protein
MKFHRCICTSQWLLIVLMMSLSATYYAQETVFIVNTRWSPDAERIATVDSQNMLHIWDTTSGDLITRFSIAGEGLTEISWSPDGAQIAASTSRDFTVRIWDVETGEVLQTLEVFPSNEEGMSVEWQPNGHYLAAVAFGERERLHFWKYTTEGFQSVESDSFTSLAYDLRWSPDGQQLAFADFAGIHVIDNFTNNNLEARRYIDQPTLWFVWSPDSSKVIGEYTTSYIEWKPSVQIIDVQTGAVLMNLPENEDFLGDLSWSTNSDKITTRGEDGVYHVWDLASQKIIDSFTLDQEIVPNYYTASPYGGRFAVTDPTSSRAANDSSLEIVVLFESIERVQGIAKRCLADTDNLTSTVTSVLNDVVINSLTELTLPAFVQSVKALPTGAIPTACSADLVAVADAVIAEK